MISARPRLHRTARPFQFGDRGKRLLRRRGVRPLQQRQHEQELVLQPDDRLLLRRDGSDAPVEDVLVFRQALAAQAGQGGPLRRWAGVDLVAQLLQRNIAAIAGE